MDVVTISELIGIDAGDIGLFIYLIASIIIAYPYKLISERLPPTLQHVLNTVTGIGIMYYCFGSTIQYVLIDICTVAVLLKLAGGTLISVLITYALVFGHLLWGYYLEYLSGSRQLANWLLPQCVVTLKLIGLAMSLYDAKRGYKPEKKSKSDSEFMLDTDKVEILEVFGFSCLFSTCVVGPQTSFNRYRHYVNGTLYDRATAVGNIRYGLTRIILSGAYGIFYLILYNILPPSDYLLTPEFERENFATKIFMSAIPFYVTYKRYTIGWLLVEASCVLMGVSYNEKEDGTYDWSECISIECLRWETSPSVKDMLSSMNISVNKWLIFYVYKRLRFLNSPNLQQIMVTLYTCVWHSLFPGVYVMFLTSIPQVMLMHIFYKILKVYSIDYKDWPLFVRISIHISYTIFLNIRMGFFFLPFLFPTADKFLKYWKSVHYFGLYVLTAELILSLSMNFLIQRSKIKEKTK